MLQTYVGVIGNPLTADGPALNTSTTPTSLLGSAAAGGDARPTLPNNFFQIGKILRVRGAGRLSGIAGTSQGTFTLDLRFGSTVVFNGGAMQLSDTVHTTVPFEFEVLLTCRTVGAGTTATLMGQGRFFSQAVVASGTGTTDSTNTHTMLMIPNTTPAVGTGFDSSATQQIDCFGTFSVSNAGNGVTLHQFVVEALN